MQTRLSQITLALLLAVAISTTIGAFVSVALPHGTFGLTFAWKRAPGHAAQLEVAAVAPDSAAARAGLAPGDRVAAFASFADRVTLTVENYLWGRPYLADGQSLNETMERGSTSRVVHLVAAPIQRHLLWFFEFRIAVYFLGMLIGGALIAARPSAVTWGFGLFVIFGLVPDVYTLEFVSMAHSPGLFLGTLLFFEPCARAAGFMGLIVFATRFPEQRQIPTLALVERSVQVFLVVLALTVVESIFGLLYGWPAFRGEFLVQVMFFVPSVTAISILAWKLARARGDDRVRLRWALAGPSIATLVTIGNTALTVGVPATPLFFSASLGLLSAIAPFSMLYAILRYRVIDIGISLNRTLAQAVSLPSLGARDSAESRRLLVRRAALLFATELPLRELYVQFAALLGAFIEAPIVSIATNTTRGAYVDCISEGGTIELERIAVVSQSPFDLVIHDGLPRLEDHAIYVPVLFGGAIVGGLGVQSHGPGIYGQEELALLEACAIYLGTRIHDEMRQPTARPVSRASDRDALTGLANRRGFEEALASQWARCMRANSPLSLILIDIDHFAVFVDTYGHIASDSCLRQVASGLRSSLEEHQCTIARYEEAVFAVILPACAAEQAVWIAETICLGVRAQQIPHQGSSLHYVSVSAGASTANPSEWSDAQTLVIAASSFLTQAQERGNRVAALNHETLGPPVLSLAVARQNLPPPLTTFVGRATEFAQLQAAMLAHRMVTITGVGGVGKTRIAIEVARRSIDQFPDGIWVVDLVSARGPEVVAQAIAAVLMSGLEPVTVDAAQLIGFLGTKRLLLLLDGCEHLTSACGELADAILEKAAGVSVLATSRTALGARHEHVIELRPLRSEDGVALFLERSGGARGAGESGNRETIERIVAQVDALPMGIELAAALGITIAPAELLAHVSEALSVGRSTRSLLEWSYHLLSVDERAVMRRLAVFSGGWTREAAMEVCSDESMTTTVVSDALESLEHKWLVLFETSGLNVRYRFAEMTRQFALAELENDRELTSVTKRFLRWAASNAEQLTRSRSEMPFGVWWQTQQSEFQNYRAALEHAFGDLPSDDVPKAIFTSLAGVLGDTQAFAEFMRPLRARLMEDSLQNEVRAVFSLALAELLRKRQPVQSLEAAQEAITSFRHCGDKRGAAYAICLLATTELRVDGSIDDLTDSMLGEALSAALEIGDRHLTVAVLRNTAHASFENGRSEKSRAALQLAAEMVDRTDVRMVTSLMGTSAAAEFRNGDVERAIAIWRRAASLAEEAYPSYAALCFLNAGTAEASRGNVDSGRALIQRGFSRLRADNNAFGIAHAFDCFAWLEKETGDMRRAARVAGFAQAAFENALRRTAPDQERFDELVEELRRKLGREVFTEEWNRGRMLSLEEAASEAHVT